MSEQAAGRDREAVLRFIERFASDLAEYGVTRMPARVFAALVATDSGRLTAAELAELLQVSPAAVSGAVRYLTRLRLAGREREPGSRRDIYRVRDDVWYEATINRDQMYQRMSATLREGIDALGAGSSAAERLADTIDFFDFMQKELPAAVERWRAQRGR